MLHVHLVLYSILNHVAPILNGAQDDNKLVARLSWGVQDAWLNAPQLLPCDYFVGP